MIPRIDVPGLNKGSHVKTCLTALALYIFLTTMLTFPLIMHMDKYLNLGDPAFNTWVLAWDVHSLTSDPLNLFNTNIFYPLTENTLAFSEHLIADMLVAFPVILITHNPVLAYNLILFLSFVLSGFGMFILINYYTKDSYSAFVGGVIFAFCAIRFAHFDHMQLLTTQWMPFALLYLDKFLHKGDYRNLALLYIFYVLQVLSCWYLAFYITIVLGVYAFGIFMTCEEARKKLFRRSYQIKSILFLICSLMAVAPFAYPYLQVAHEYGFTRTLEEVALFSADLGDYFLTPINNLVYGRISSPFQTDRFAGEHSLFPGFAVIILSLCGLFSVCRVKLNDQRRLALIDVSNKMQKIYLVIGLVALILSLGYPLHFFGHVIHIDLPYKYLFEYFPGFKSMRVPSRFAIMLMLSLSVLAGYGLSRLIDSEPKIKRATISLVVLSIIVVESLYIPVPINTIPTGQEIPEVYKWLANETGDFAMVELPMGLFNDTRYMFYSTYHWKKLVNGYSGFVPDYYSGTMKELLSFPSHESINLLKNLEVKYVVVHAKYINESRWNRMRALSKDYDREIHLKISFDDDYVYEINNTVSDTVPEYAFIYGSSGLYAVEDWSGVLTRWMQADSKITIISSKNRTADLVLNARSFSRNRTLEIFSGGEMVTGVAVPEGFINVSVPIYLRKGVNTVRFHVPEGCERPSDKPELNRPDDRCLSLAVQNLTLM